MILTPELQPPDEAEATTLEHVERAPLPWREPTRTECGLPAGGKHPVISRTEFVAKVQRLGPRRAALTTCLTCFETAQRWPTWEVDPCRRIAREVRSADWKQDTQLRDELTAMAELISRHRPEFDSILASLGETVRLADHRRKVRRTGA